MKRDETILKLFEDFEDPYPTQPIPERKRDARSYEMRKILQQAFPKNKFSVKIEKYSMGESIHIKTDLIQPWTAEDSDNQFKRGTDMGFNTPSMQATKQKQEYNKAMEQKIESLLQKFWHIDWDKQSGEILGGGNTFIDIGAIDPAAVEENLEEEDTTTPDNEPTIKLAIDVLKAFNITDDNKKIEFLINKGIREPLIRQILIRSKEA
jgi:hypothetical protein